MKHFAVILAAMTTALAAFPLMADEVTTNIRIQFFVFGIDEKAAHVLLSERGDDTELFGEVMNRYEKDEAEIVTTASIVARSGQRAKVEAIQEVIYATAFELVDENKVIPTAFETRKVGTILEVDPVIGADGETIDVNLVPEHHLAPPVMKQLVVGIEGKDDDSVITMPQFFLEKVTTSTRLKNGEARLLGTVDPTAILMGSGEEDSLKGQLHLFFMKVDLVR